MTIYSYLKTLVLLFLSLFLNGAQAASCVYSGNKVIWSSTCTITGLDLSGKDFSGGSFMSDLNGNNVNFSGANFTGAMITALFSKTTSTYIGANFKGANLSKVKSGTTNFSNADFTGANFTAAKFAAANLSGANLSNANLADANFYDGNLPAYASNFAGANLTGAQFTKGTLISADFTKANLSKANFSGANLTGANLTGANLSNANFSGANLAGVNLTGADLSNAIFASAKLNNVILTNANLSNANFLNANLISASSVTSATITNADFSGATWWDGTICTAGNKGMCQPPFMSKEDLAKVIKWINTSVAASKTPFCYLNSWGRGVGVPVSACPEGKVKDGSLCYDACRNGYSSDGATMCYQNCPGWSATLTSCTKPAMYDRGIGIAPDLDTVYEGGLVRTRRECKSNRQMEDGMCYEKPRDGFKCTVTVCSPRCPDGMTDFGVGCTKNSYNRGVGTPMTCQPGEEMDASLCYKSCGPNTKGIGPVCWQNCYPGTKVCGAGCAADTATCATTVTDMIMGPAQMAMNIVSLGVSSASLNTVLRTAKLALEAEDTEKAIELALTVNSLVIEAFGNFDKMVPADVLSTVSANFGPKGKAWIAREYALNLVAVSYNFTGLALNLIGMVDPSGVSATIAAYKQPVCSRLAPMPSVTVLNKN